MFQFTPLCGVNRKTTKKGNKIHKMCSKCKIFTQNCKNKTGPKFPVKKYKLKKLFSYFFDVQSSKVFRFTPFYGIIIRVITKGLIQRSDNFLVHSRINLMCFITFFSGVPIHPTGRGESEHMLKSLFFLRLKL